MVVGAILDLSFPVSKIIQTQTKSAEIYLKNGDFQVKKVEKVEFEGKGIEEYQ